MLTVLQTYRTKGPDGETSLTLQHAFFIMGTILSPSPFDLVEPSLEVLGRLHVNTIGEVC